MEYSKKLFNGMIVTINKSMDGTSWQAQVTPNFVNHILKKDFREAEKAFKLHWDFYLNSFKEEDEKGSDGDIITGAPGLIQLSDEAEKRLAEENAAKALKEKAEAEKKAKKLAKKQAKKLAKDEAKEAKRLAKEARKNINSTSDMPTSDELPLDNAGDQEKAAGRRKWLLRKLGRTGEARNPVTTIDESNPFHGDGSGRGTYMGYNDAHTASLAAQGRPVGDWTD